MNRLHMICHSVSCITIRLPRSATTRPAGRRMPLSGGLWPRSSILEFCRPQSISLNRRLTPVETLLLAV